MIPRIPHPWHPGPYPYDVFAGTGLSPRSSHAEVLDSAFRLQAEGKMTHDLRRAWDEIRAVPRRLATDFFLYNPALSDPAELLREGDLPGGGGPRP